MELDWAVVDRSGQAIFPGGKLFETPDTCNLNGRDASGTRRYTLEVGLSIYERDCVESFDAGALGGGDTGETTGGASSRDDCLVVRERFSCTRARGALTDVPASDDPYVMEMDVWITPRGASEPSQVDESCIATPGPRARQVLPGRITDLALYQIVALGIELDDDSAGGLNLNACLVD